MFDHRRRSHREEPLSASTGDGDQGPGGQTPVAGPDQQPPRLSGRSSYSAFVSILKIVLPALAVGLIILVVVWPQLDFGKRDFRVGVSRLEPETAGNLSMLNPRFQGVDKGGNPFTITADVATQETAESETVLLDLPKGDIILDDNGWMSVQARKGTFDRDGKTLSLEGGVDLFHGKGYELHTPSATVDLDKGTAVSDEPTHGSGKFGTINSQGVRLSEGGDRVLFTGESRLVLNPASEEAQ